MREVFSHGTSPALCALKEQHSQRASRAAARSGYVRKDATYVFRNEVTAGRVVTVRRASTQPPGAAPDPAAPLYAVVSCFPGGHRALTGDLSPVGKCSLRELLPADWDRLRKAAYQQAARGDGALPSLRSTHTGARRAQPRVLGGFFACTLRDRRGTPLN